MFYWEFFFFSSNISQSRLETFLVLPSFFREERIKDFVTKKRFSLLLERRRITWRLTACLIVNRGTGALTANALAANLQKNTRNMESFFFSLMALSYTGMGYTVAFSPSLHRNSRMCWDIKHFLSYWGLGQEPLGNCTAWLFSIQLLYQVGLMEVIFKTHLKMQFICFFINLFLLKFKLWILYFKFLGGHMHVVGMFWCVIPAQDWNVLNACRMLCGIPISLSAWRWMLPLTAESEFTRWCSVLLAWAAPVCPSHSTSMQLSTENTKKLAQ